jgi:branched-chain amino acid transport system substrate-binding protein
MGSRRLAGVATVAIAGALVVAGCGSNSSSGGSSGSGKSGIPSGPIKLGALFTMSGPSAPIGVAQKAAFTALVNRLNQEGGIAGHQVQLVSYNDKGDPAVAVAMATKLVSDKVAAIVYHGTSATNSQTVPVFTKAKLPQVVLDGTVGFDDPKKLPYTFTTYPSFDQTTAKTVEYAISQGTKTLGLITDGLPYGKQLENGLKKAAAGKDIKLVGPVTYSPTAVDVTTQLRQLKSQGVDGIAVLAATGIGHIYDGLRTLGWTPHIYGTEVARFVGYDALGSLADDVTITCNVPLKQGSSLDPGIANVLKTVSAKTGVTPTTPSSVIFNDDLGIVKAAIERAKSTDSTALKNTLEHMADVSYTSPEYSYTFSSTQHNGFPGSKVGICRVKPMGPYDYGYAAPGQ